MSWKHVLNVLDLLDRPDASGHDVLAYLSQYGEIDGTVTTVDGTKGSTDFVRVVIPGSRGKLSGGDAPTIGITGQLGGVGARPVQIGFASDGDGALTAIAAAAKLLEMKSLGDVIAGDVIMTTHVDPDAPTRPHEPVPQMGATVDLDEIVRNTVSPDMDAILSIDATKGNRICNVTGFAITPTVKEGWILRVSETLISIAERTSGRPAVTLPITTQDITPYSSGAYHMNSILQPSTATTAPVVGVAITAEAMVGGSATGASDMHSIESAVRFVIEVAKDFTSGRARFHDPEEFTALTTLYGSLRHLQTSGS